MKNYKSKDRSLYILLIKNYIIYTLVMVLLMLGIYFFELLVEESIIQSPRVHKSLGGQELLKAGEYEELDLKELLGSTGYFEVLDESGLLIYSDYSGRNESYTKREIECIPEYNSHDIYTAPCILQRMEKNRHW